MIKRILATLTAITLTFSAAEAAVFDFVAEAAVNPGGIPQGYAMSAGGIGLSITANPVNPFLDPVFSGRPGGLGACIVIAWATDFCDPNIAGNTDNVGVGESVTLTFDRKVDISNLSFNSGNHKSLNNSPQTLLVNGVEWTFQNLFLAVLSGISVLTLAYGGSGATEFYVSSLTAVPIPAAAPLLLSGLAGLAFAARRECKAA